MLGNVIYLIITNGKILGVVTLALLVFKFSFFFCTPDDGNSLNDYQEIGYPFLHDIGQTENYRYRNMQPNQEKQGLIIQFQLRTITTEIE